MTDPGDRSPQVGDELWFGLVGQIRVGADDEVSNTIIADLDLRWLYAPYDGGGDVLAPTVQARDDLRTRHKNWLSTYPGGL